MKVLTRRVDVSLRNVVKGTFSFDIVMRDSINERNLPYIVRFIVLPYIILSVG